MGLYLKIKENILQITWAFTLTTTWGTYYSPSQCGTLGLFQNLKNAAGTKGP